MTPLAQRIRDSIRANGPMPVSLYMLMCLHDPQYGYYATRPALNVDFTTAPETSQIFGELLGLWCAHEWLQMGSPAEVRLVELGPGRGVMMSDMLRAGRAVPGFIDAVRISLVEASPALRLEQQNRLVGRTVEFFQDLEDVPPGPAIIVANEFLDCLSIRQYMRDGNGWRERAIGVNAENELVFGVGLSAELPAQLIPVGDQVEYAPGLDALIEMIARRFRRDPGRALIIDYGPEDRSPGDTLRAYQRGQQVDPLVDPGACDLTADVDFPRLRRIALSEGLTVHGPMRQGYFLTRLGAWERSKILGKSNPARAEEIANGVTRLTSPEDMGARFKVICFTPHGAPTPAGF